MPLIAMPELLGRALRGGYAVGYFEAWDLASLEAVLEAAEAAQSPVILGFGGVMMDQAWLDDGAIERLGALGRATAEAARVPVSFLLNEVFTLDQIGRGLRAGFNTVMLMTAAHPFDENLRLTRQVVDLAGPAGAAVEAELGHLPEAGAEAEASSAASVTDPDQAAEFVRQTGVTALAVSIGNVHGLSSGQATIDFERLRAIGTLTRTPLVIHGGTGYPDQAVGPAIEAGVAKFNVGKILKQRFWAGLQTALAATPADADPHVVIGSRKPGDVVLAGKQLMQAEVTRRMHVYRSAGRARD